MDHLVGTYIVDHVFYYDAIDNEINAMVHDLSTPENSLSVFIWDYLLPDRQRGSAIEGILTLEFVQSYEKKPVDSVSHIQAFNHIGLEAVVKVVKILDSYHVLVKADFSDKLLLVCFESSVHPEPCDFIHVKGELHLEDSGYSARLP